MSELTRLEYDHVSRHLLRMFRDLRKERPEDLARQLARLSVWIAPEVVGADAEFSAVRELQACGYVHRRTYEKGS